MKRLRIAIAISAAGMATLLFPSHAAAQEKLLRGKDRIDTPAVGTGLCVHTLY